VRNIVVVVLMLAAAVTNAQTFGKREKYGNGMPVAISASFISLFGRPSEFDKKRVFIVGFLGGDWEGMQLFLNSEQCRIGFEADGIWLQDQRNDVKLYEINKKECVPVLIEGVFVAAKEHQYKPTRIEMVKGDTCCKLFDINYISDEL